MIQPRNEYQEAPLIRKVNNSPEDARMLNPEEAKSKVKRGIIFLTTRSNR